jgi:hypothetical protein
MTNDDRAAAITRMVPQLFRASGNACRTWSLLDGVNRSIEKNSDAINNCMAVAGEYRQVCVELIVVQLTALLDRNEKRVSFQAVNRNLNDEVAEILSTQASKALANSAWFPDHCKQDLKKFQDAYRQIDWNDVHGRLKHFRDHAVAHIFEKRFQKTINFGETRALVLAVSRMTEGIGFLNRPHGVLDEGIIEHWTKQTKEVWDGAFRAIASSRVGHGEDE